MTDENAVLTERRGRTLLITLNRPDARNAVNAALAQGVASALDELDSDDDLSVGVLTGAGKGFSAGMDLKAFVAGESAWVEGRGFAGIVQGPPRKPLIAAIEGFAVAGGLEVALSCDLIVAASGAKLGIPEVKRSLVAAGGALLRLPRRIPYHVAMELALTGDPITAERGYELGLVNRVADAGGAVDAALELAGRDRGERAAGADGLQADRDRVARLEPATRSSTARPRSPARCSPRRTRARAPPPSPRSATPSGRAAEERGMAGSLRGKLLIAAPQLLDYFRRTVLLVVEHTDEGAMGVVLNRPTDNEVAALVPELAELAGEGEVVHAGGPVNPDSVLALGDFEDPAGRGHADRRPARAARPRAGAPAAAPPARVRGLRRAGRPASSTPSWRRTPGSWSRPRPTTRSPTATCGRRCSSARAAPTPCWPRMPADPTLN